MVAKDGYDALMTGKPKIVPGGPLNKAYEMMAYAIPQETLANRMRYGNTPKEETQKESNASAWAIGLGIAAAVVAGVALVTAYNNADLATKTRYRYKAGRLKYKANGLYDDAKDALADGWDAVKAKKMVHDVKESLADGWNKAKKNVDLDDAKDTLTNGWDSVKSKAKSAVA
jgi:uncharacterized protein